MGTAQVPAVRRLPVRGLLLPSPSVRAPQRQADSSRPAHSLATLQALALRAHGGPAGHEQHKNKLADRSKQAAATRVKNGTVQRSKYSGFWGASPDSSSALPPCVDHAELITRRSSGGLYGGGYGNDYYSDDDGYGHCG